MAIHATLAKFNAPETTLFQFGHWDILLRPDQVTLGALVVVHRDPTFLSLAEIPAADFADLKEVFSQIEHVSKSLFDAEKFNYMALMMVDPHVHFHVFSRYSKPACFLDTDWPDEHWPGPVNLGRKLTMTTEQFTNLHREMKLHFQQQGV